jgi:hypothetical protein
LGRRDRHVAELPAGGRERASPAARFQLRLLDRHKNDLLPIIDFLICFCILVFNDLLIIGITRCIASFTMSRQGPTG